MVKGFFFKWRGNIFYNFESYFGKPQKVKDENEEEVRPSGPDVGVKFDYQKYQWLMMVEKLCEKLNMKPEEVYDMNYLDSLNWLSMWNQKEKFIQQQMKQK
jgi:hypothetical protein